MPVVQFPKQPATWLSKCLMSDGKNPKPLSNHSNAMIALRNDPALKDAIGYDGFACTVVLFCEPGGEPFEDGPHRFTDKDAADICEIIQHAGLKSISLKIVSQAIESSAMERWFHPVRDYFGSLAWDGIQRLKTWLPVYAGTAMTDYEMRVGPMFLIQMVARIYAPGCKADYMLVLEGEQGDAKSQLCRILAEPWFSEHLPDISIGKDASIHIAGKWLIEVAELDALSKAETTRRKSFLSRTVEQYRRPYGHFEVEEYRQCVFVGTTNQDSYLKDGTGNRRYWPVRCSNTIDLDGLRRDRDQLFAEAIHRYRAGEKWWPDRSVEKTIIKPQQADRYELDEWASPIADHLKTTRRTTVAEIARQALGLELSRLGKSEQMRIASILKWFKWVPKRSDKDRWWEPNTTE